MEKEYIKSYYVITEDYNRVFNLFSDLLTSTPFTLSNRKKRVKDPFQLMKDLYLEYYINVTFKQCFDGKEPFIVFRGNTTVLCLEKDSGIFNSESKKIFDELVDVLLEIMKEDYKVDFKFIAEK